MAKWGYVAAGASSTVPLAGGRRLEDSAVVLTVAVHVSGPAGPPFFRPLVVQNARERGDRLALRSVPLVVT